MAAVAWSVVMQWGLRSVQLGTYLVLARLLVPADFGSFALATAMVGLVETMASLGMTEAVAQHRAPTRVQLDAAHTLVLVTGAVAAAAVAVAGAALMIVTDGPLPVVLVGLSGTLLLGAWRVVPEALLRRNLQFREVATAAVLGTATGAAAAILVAERGGGLWALIVQQLVTYLTTGIAIRRRVRSTRLRLVNPNHARELANVGWRIATASTLSSVNRKADDLFLGAHQPANVVGLYTAGYTLSDSAETGISGALAQVALPAFSRVADEPARLRARYLRSVQASVVISFPVFATLAAFALPAVVVLLGRSWQGAAPVLALVAAMSFIRSAGHLNAPLLVTVGRSDVVLRIMVGQAAASTMLFATVAPWGMIAMAWAVVARVAASLPVTLFAVRRCAGVELTAWSRLILAPAACAALSAVAALMFTQAMPVAADTAAVLVVGVGLSVVFYLGSMAVVAPHTLAGVLNHSLGRIARKPQET